MYRYRTDFDIDHRIITNYTPETMRPAGKNRLVLIEQGRVERQRRAFSAFNIHRA